MSKKYVWLVWEREDGHAVNDFLIGVFSEKIKADCICSRSDDRYLEEVEVDSIK